MFSKIPADSILNTKIEKAEEARNKMGILPSQLFYIGLARKPLEQ